MSRLTWGNPYQEGLSQVVLYGDQARAWNGVESFSLEEEELRTTRYQDGRPMAPRVSPGELTGTITAYTTPSELSTNPIDARGLRTNQRTFGLSYIDSDHLHLFYNLSMVYEGREELSLSDEPDVEVFTWNFSGMPVSIPGHAFSGHLVISMEEVHPDTLMDLLNLLYGEDGVEAVLPSPVDILTMFDVTARLVITDNGDGTWTATETEPGIIEMLSPTEFKIGYESAIFINQESYNIRTY